jgi:hypothetical protein
VKSDQVCVNEFGLEVESTLGENLEFTPCGAVGPIGFHKDSCCGKARNSVGLSYWDWRDKRPSGGMVMTAEQVDALLCFLLEAKRDNPIKTTRADALIAALNAEQKEKG